MPVLAQLLVNHAVDVDAGDGECPTGRGDASEIVDMCSRVRPADNDAVTLGDQVLHGEVRREGRRDHGEPVEYAFPARALPGQRIMLRVVRGDEVDQLINSSFVDQGVQPTCEILVASGVHDASFSTAGDVPCSSSSYPPGVAEQEK